MSEYVKSYMKPSNIELDQQLDKLVVNFSGIPFQSTAIIGEKEFTLSATQTRSSTSGGGLIIADSSKSNDYKINYTLTGKFLSFFKNFDNTISCISTTYNEDIENYTFDIEVAVENDSGSKSIFTKTGLKGSEPILLSKELFKDIVDADNQFLYIYLNNVKSTDSINYGLVLSISNSNSIVLPKAEYPNGIYTVQLIGQYGDNIFTNSFEVTTKYGNIILYNCKSDNNVLVKDIEEVVTLEGFYRREVSILNPVITIEIDNPYKDFEHAPNYLYNKDFDRYYYINDITMVRKGIWELSCQVDVLMSFKDEIMKLEGVLDRCQKIDGELDYEIDDNNITFLPQSDFQINIGVDSDIKLPSLNIYNDNLICYCLNGFVPTNRFEEVYPDSKKRVTNIIASNTPIFMSYKGIQECFNKILTAAGNDLGAILGINPKDCITSLKMFPFDVLDVFEVDDVIAIPKMVLGNQYSGNLNSNAYYILRNKQVILSGGNILIPENTQYPFLNTNNHTSFSLFIPFYGYLDIPYERVFGKTIVLNYLIDVSSGQSFAYLSYFKENYTKYDYIKEYFLKVNVDFSITIPFLNGSGQESFMATLAGQVGGNLVQGIQSGMVYNAGGSKNMLKGKLMSLDILSTSLNLAGSAITAMIPKMSLEKNTDKGWLNFLDYYEKNGSTYGTIQMHCIIWQQIPSIDEISYSKFFGSIRKIKEYKLSLCHGIASFNQVHVDNLGNATYEEKNTVENLLYNGVILP